MENYKEVIGNLITLANSGDFDVIAQGCNCFCVQGAGLAPQMVKYYETDKFPMEQANYRGDINKLGTIDYQIKTILIDSETDRIDSDLVVVNCYTQFDTAQYPGHRVLDYNALSLCLKKINHLFKGKRIGLPLIGGGLAGGDTEVIKAIIKREMPDCYVTLVLFG